MLYFLLIINARTSFNELDLKELRAVKSSCKVNQYWHIATNHFLNQNMIICHFTYIAQVIKQSNY